MLSSARKWPRVGRGRRRLLRRLNLLEWAPHVARGARRRARAAGGRAGDASMGVLVGLFRAARAVAVGRDRCRRRSSGGRSSGRQLRLICAASAFWRRPSVAGAGRADVCVRRRRRCRCCCRCCRPIGAPIGHFRRQLVRPPPPPLDQRRARARDGPVKRAAATAHLNCSAPSRPMPPPPRRAQPPPAEAAEAAAAANERVARARPLRGAHPIDCAARSADRAPLARNEWLNMRAMCYAFEMLDPLGRLPLHWALAAAAAAVATALGAARLVFGLQLRLWRAAGNVCAPRKAADEFTFVCSTSAAAAAAAPPGGARAPR